jgi:hypothetical protein
MGDLLAAAMQRDGVTKNTKDEEVRVWKRWTNQASAIAFAHDVLLSNLLPEQWTDIIGAFATALCW